MSKICGYSCEHNKSGVCQISVCDKKSIISDKTEIQTLRLDELDYTIIPNSDIKPLLDRLQQENKQLKDNWNKLKEYLINDINNRNGNKVVEYEDGRKASETISPIYTLMEDKSKTMKEVLDKMQELEQGSDSNE